MGVSHHAGIRICVFTCAADSCKICLEEAATFRPIRNRIQVKDPL
jgi:hypothetical protein